MHLRPAVLQNTPAGVLSLLYTLLCGDDESRASWHAGTGPAGEILISKARRADRPKADARSKPYARGSDVYGLFLIQILNKYAANSS